MAVFKAIVIEKVDSGTKAALTDFDEANLMDGDVTVRVEYSTRELQGRSRDHGQSTGGAPLPNDCRSRLRRHSGNRQTTRPGKPGDKVVLNGWGCGETHLGAYAEKARVKGDWLVPLPKTMSTRDAMAIGTAGYTAMLAVMALERHGLHPANGPIAVTGAAGGVGSVAIAHPRQARIRRARGHRPAAGGGLSEGARRRRDRRAQGAGRPVQPLAKERWAGAIDCRRVDHAGKSPVDDPLRRGGSRLWPCRRHGLAGLGRPVHFARGVPLRHRIR